MIAIENVRLFDEVQASTRELSEALEQQTATSQVLGGVSLPSPAAAPAPWRARACIFRGAGVTDRLWSIGDVVNVLEAWEAAQ